MIFTGESVGRRRKTIHYVVVCKINAKKGEVLSFQKIPNILFASEDTRVILVTLMSDVCAFWSFASLTLI